ncbi:hypothetical protein [Streptomyces sp. NPDC048142]|uniref:hypothetical protein n=1 Tax=Streptomyces sp. NPDC048142 TaxID=3365501 RepID=UPI00372346CD
MDKLTLELTEEEAELLGWAVVGMLKETRQAARTAEDPAKAAGYTRTVGGLQELRNRLDAMLG